MTTATSLRERLSDDRAVALLFLLPGVACLLLTYFLPLAYSAVLSFSSWDIRTPGAEIVAAGLQNYRDVLADPGFWAAFRRSAVFTLVALPLELLFGTAVAVLLTSERVDRYVAGVARVALLVPLMLPPVVVGILWRLVFNVEYGPLNGLLAYLGVEPLPWVSSPDTAMYAVVLVEVLTNMSVVAMILIGGLLGLPREPIRAAQMDGATPLRILLEIKLPQLLPYYLIVILIRTMDLLKAFDFIYAMTFGGPGESTQVLNFFIFRLGSRFLEFAPAAAASWIFLLLLLPFAIALLLRSVRASHQYLND